MQIKLLIEVFAHFKSIGIDLSTIPQDQRIKYIQEYVSRPDVIEEIKKKNILATKKFTKKIEEDFKSDLPSKPEIFFTHKNQDYTLFLPNKFRGNLIIKVCPPAPVFNREWVLKNIFPNDKFFYLGAMHLDDNLWSIIFSKKAIKVVDDVKKILLPKDSNINKVIFTENIEIPEVRLDSDFYPPANKKLFNDALYTDYPATFELK